MLPSTSSPATDQPDQATEHQTMQQNGTAKPEQYTACQHKPRHKTPRQAIGRMPPHSTASQAQHRQHGTLSQVVQICMVIITMYATSQSQNTKPCQHKPRIGHAMVTTSMPCQQPPSHAMPKTCEPRHGDSLRAMSWRQPIRHVMATV